MLSRNCLDLASIQTFSLLYVLFEPFLVETAECWGAIVKRVIKLEKRCSYSSGIVGKKKRGKEMASLLLFHYIIQELLYRFLTEKGDAAT